MPSPRRGRAVTLLLILFSLFILNCNTWTRIAPAITPANAPVLDPQLPNPPAEIVEPASATQALPILPVEVVEVPANAGGEPGLGMDKLARVPGAGEPAGCLAAPAQDGLSGAADMLAYAGTLIDLQTPFPERLLPNTWNGYTSLFTWQELDVLSISVSDVQNAFVIQRMLNALQVAGFVTWLRETEGQGLHILAIPLRDPALMQSAWAPYVEAYWRGRSTLPEGDPSVLPALKLPPCAWMVERGFAPPVNMDWWAADVVDWPDYAAAAEAYVAPTTGEAEQVAQSIDWLGADFPEGPSTMCGPLVWSILRDAGAFPPGWGEWLAGPKTFWLAQPEKNGRPWSLFPRESYEVFRFSQPLGEFDFREFPLYPGDFLYTYAYKDGFEHMLLVTEVDAAGGAYTVSNIVREEPQKQITIERTLLLNFNDPTQGIARNQWALDKINGRTGHAGFEVFRWAWMQKDITGQPVSETVLPGDTFGQLAARWKTPAALIAEYNGMAVDAPLEIGQVVMIPPNARVPVAKE